MMIKEIISKDYCDLNKLANSYRNKFINNSPFPHIVFDNFFNKKFLNFILKKFPNLLNKKNTTTFNTKTDKNKTATDLNFIFPREISYFLNFLNSNIFINFIQKITNVKETLIPDPYFFGGGLHEIKNGGFLKIHTDFNYHPSTLLDRRINLLIYLNKNWKKKYKGELELWDKNVKKNYRKYLPIFNRIVIFNTNDFTYHGHPEPLNIPKNISRKSIALYYYSNGRPKEEINSQYRYHNTIYKNRKNRDGNFDERIPVYKKIFGKIYIRKKIKS